MKKCVPVIVICLFVMMSCAPPRALEYRTYHNLELRNLGFDHSTLYLELEYYNPNNFGMRLKKTDLDVYIDGTFLGHSASDTVIQIPRKSTFLLPIDFDVNMKNAFKNAWNSIRGKEMVIKLSGKVLVGKGKLNISFPVEYETKQTFSLF